MSHPFLGGVVVYAKDIGRLSRFYSAVAGLSITEEDVDYVVLEAAGFQLVIVAMAPAIAARINVGSPSARRENTVVKPCLAVADVDAARRAASEFAGALNPPEREWTFEGHRVCDGGDPEGNVIQLRARRLSRHRAAGATRSKTGEAN